MNASMTGNLFFHSCLVLSRLSVVGEGYQTIYDTAFHPLTFGKEFFDNTAVIVEEAKLRDIAKCSNTTSNSFRTTLPLKEPLNLKVTSQLTYETNSYLANTVVSQIFMNQLVWVMNQVSCL
jgi:hypothetical protein